MYPDFPRTVLVYTCSSIITNSTFLVSMVNDSHPNKKWHRPSVWGRGGERKDSHRQKNNSCFGLQTLGGNVTNEAVNHSGQHAPLLTFYTPFEAAFERAWRAPSEHAQRALSFLGSQQTSRDDDDDTAIDFHALLSLCSFPPSLERRSINLRPS